MARCDHRYSYDGEDHFSVNLKKDWKNEKWLICFKLIITVIIIIKLLFVIPNIQKSIHIYVKTIILYVTFLDVYSSVSLSKIKKNTTKYSSTLVLFALVTIFKNKISLDVFYDSMRLAK